MGIHGKSNGSSNGTGLGSGNGNGREATPSPTSHAHLALHSLPAISNASANIGTNDGHGHRIQIYSIKTVMDVALRMNRIQDCLYWIFSSRWKELEQNRINNQEIDVHPRVS